MPPDGLVDVTGGSSDRPNLHPRHKPFRHFHTDPHGGAVRSIKFGGGPAEDFEPIWSSTRAEREDRYAASASTLVAQLGGDPVATRSAHDCEWVRGSRRSIGTTDGQLDERWGTPASLSTAVVVPCIWRAILRSDETVSRFVVDATAGRLLSVAMVSADAHVVRWTGYSSAGSWDVPQRGAWEFASLKNALVGSNGARPAIRGAHPSVRKGDRPQQAFVYIEANDGGQLQRLLVGVSRSEVRIVVLDATVSSAIFTAARARLLFEAGEALPITEVIDSARCPGWSSSLTSGG